MRKVLVKRGNKLMKTNCCIRCGQDLRLAEIEWDYQRSMTSQRGELCGNCAASLAEEEEEYYWN
jgi:uncharacterized CHY-type Zn-finger protein